MNDRQPVLVGDRYELGELLGRGGMAEVRRGTDQRLGRTVAVKRLRTDLASDSIFQARFRREAQSSASLNHPSIVAVYDTGDEDAFDTSTGAAVAQPYIVMEYVEGRTLRDILREGRKILPERALEITSGVLSALDYSHRAGIIHRDIKPGNVMLTPAGDVKVMDFGIARAMSDTASTMTQTAAVVGTAQYLSPEQARGEQVDSRSDVYSAGCLLYELLTGRPPFVGDSPVSVAYQHVREPVSPPSDHDTELTPEIDAIVLKALAKRVEDRYRSAADMRADIQNYLAGRPVVTPVPAPQEQHTRVGPPLAATVPAAALGGVDEGGPPTSDSVLSGMGTRDEYDSEPSRAGLWVLLVLLLSGILAAGFLLGPQLFESPPEEVQIPNLIGLTEDQARNAIGDAGLVVGGIDSRENDDVPVGQVLSQSPNRDQYVPPGSSVSFVVSEGKPLASVPDVVGDRRNAAAARLRDADLRIKPIKEESDLPAGEVIRIEPAAGTEVEQDTLVQLYYSDGPETVPDVVGLNREDASELIRARGFKPFVVKSGDTDQLKGTVFDQNPAANQEAPQETRITIVVSTFEEPEPEPEPDPDATATPDPTPTPDPGDAAGNGNGRAQGNGLGLLNLPGSARRR